MKRLAYCLVVLALVGATASAARAQTAPPPPDATPAAGEPPAAPMPPSSHPLVGPAIGYFTAAAVGADANPTWQFGISGKNFSFGIGLNIEYNGNGLNTSAAGVDSNKFAFTPSIFGAYYVYNKFPVAIGPELAVVADLAPNSFTTTVIVPGIQFLYAPFNAPVLVGTALDLNIIMIKDAKTIVQTAQPQLRVTYAF